MKIYVLVAFFAPLISFVLAGLFARAKKSLFIGLLSTFFILVSTICSFILLEVVVKTGSIGTVYLGEFIYSGLFRSDFALMVDELSITMMVVVGVVASVVHIYSLGYMENDSGFNKFFAYLGLFVFSMLFLVMSDNFIGLFIGWEGVGLCSWLLIGFWYDRKKISWYANEAFIMNRVADLGMLVGIFIVFVYVGSIRYQDLFLVAPTLSANIVFFMAIALFIGAMGKSAQFPFHTWLADAMAGPTPVSALIHAATMVTAGVYLVVRLHPVFALTQDVSMFIAYLGAFVAIFAASMALVHSDLKKIIAYSTLSQLGYMFVAGGLGAYNLAIFHLVTHAFFKSLLFLCAGNVMHAMNDELDIHKMGGLSKFLKPTLVLMTVASLALVGLYPFAGFFSKDPIIEAAFANTNFGIWLVLLVGALFTAFYSFRLIMLVFFGKAKYSHHPHEAKVYMLISLCVLGILSIVAGFFKDGFDNFTAKALPKLEQNLSSSTELVLVFITLGVVCLGIGVAIYAYKKEIFKDSISSNPLYKILKNEYFIPKFYKEIIVKGYIKVSSFCVAIDMKVIDKSVDLIATMLMRLGRIPNDMQSGDLSLMIRFMIVGFILLLSFVFVV